MKLINDIVFYSMCLGILPMGYMLGIVLYKTYATAKEEIKKNGFKLFELVEEEK